MPQFQVRIAGQREETTRIFGLLESIFEDGDTPISLFETPEGWAVDAWIMGEDAQAVEARVRDILGADAFGAPLSVEPVDPDVDWVAVSLAGLKPVVAGRFVVHGEHDRDAVPAGAIGLRIEANQAFGTGHHPTTWGCLTALSRLLSLHHFDAMFDLGTGSGVLAIALAKATRRPVLASDIDPLSVEIALENAAINGVAGRVSVVTAAGFDHSAIRGRLFQLIVANILADPLKQLAPQFRRHTLPGARVVLSGILSSQAPGVLAAFGAQGFARERAIVREGWSTLVLARR
jgi:ribosomal protein L11 methyltransferase